MKTDNPKPSSGAEENAKTNAQTGGATHRPGGPYDYSVNEEDERAERLKKHDKNEGSGWGGSL